MKKSIITVIGHDRPGILADVSEALFLKGCNIENVSQTILQGEFAGIFIISKPESFSDEQLSVSLNGKLKGEFLDVHVTGVEVKQQGQAEIPVSQFIITTSGPDRKGLVAAITRKIADHGVNITSLKAVFKGYDDPDDNIMIYSIDVPDDIDRNRLLQELKNEAEKYDLDISIQHRNIFDAVNRI